MSEKLSERLERIVHAPGIANHPAYTDAIREAAELARRVEWLPIETAPRGGVEFLSVANYTDEPRQIQIVDWDFVQQCQPGLYTHWMPLPEPPEVE